ncbi:DUF2502 domain-containing protein [Erwinia sp. V71]|uniref:DUF2502 domain-containing protein n=1 Tax=Erwinia sp. V71 TaxID=3369424 RepID=UPI003F5EF4BC
MKRAIIFAALLASTAPLALHTAQASSAEINIAPGITLHLGDRDNRGYYWDGGRWRDDRWWRHEEWRRHREWERERAWRDHERSREWHHRHDDRRPPPLPPGPPGRW